MNWNVTSTGTVVGEPQFDGTTLWLSVLAITRYVDAEGNLRRRNLMFHLAHRGKDVEVVAGRLSKMSRVGFEGYFTGPTYLSNESYPKSLSVNGPVIHYGDDGNPYTSLNIVATSLKVIGNPIKDLEEIEDQTTVVLWGFLGRDAEMKYTPQGRLVTQTSMAVNRFYYETVDEETVKYDVTTWWRVTLWGDRGETAAEYWKKGRGFIMKGVPSVNNETGAPNIWESASGEHRASYELNVYSWTFAPAPRNGGGYQPKDEDFSAPPEEYEEEIPF